MRIVAFSVGPVFKAHVHGGSQRVLRELALHLAQRGHDVTIMCTARADNDKSFSLGPGATVYPTLRLRPTYPEPYATAPYNIVDLFGQVRTRLVEADVFYIHDAELPFPALYDKIPTVVSFRDFIYPDTLVGAFGFAGDRLVLASEYMAACVRASFSRCLPEIGERITVIPNGVDLMHFKGRLSLSSDLLELLGSGAGADVTLLYPHRPDSRKGIYDVLEVTARLKRYFEPRGQCVKLLVPVWLDSNIADTPHEYQALYGALTRHAQELGISECLHLHPWIPYRLMSDYYSAGSVTLCLGSFPEAFGNVPLESIACGTPCIVSRVGALATKLDPPLLETVPMGDVDGASRLIIELLARPYPTNEARDVLRVAFSASRMVDEYERVFATTVKGAPLNWVYDFELSDRKIVATSPWCRFDGLGLYHDYLEGRVDDPRLISLARFAGSGVQIRDIIFAGYSLDEITTGIASGVVSLFGEDSLRPLGGLQ
jgi:glycosyltransferase involved in cell wall biosynthesis